MWTSAGPQRVRQQDGWTGRLSGKHGGSSKSNQITSAASVVTSLRVDGKITDSWFHTGTKFTPEWIHLWPSGSRLQWIRTSTGLWVHVCSCRLRSNCRIKTQSVLSVPSTCWCCGGVDGALTGRSCVHNMHVSLHVVLKLQNNKNRAEPQETTFCWELAVIFCFPVELFLPPTFETSSVWLQYVLKSSRSLDSASPAIVWTQNVPRSFCWSVQVLNLVSRKSQRFFRHKSLAACWDDHWTLSESERKNQSAA